MGIAAWSLPTSWADPAQLRRMLVQASKH